jgi:proline iminopeptidase
MDVKRFLNNAGMMDVGGGHQIYWEDWGNPKAEVPIFYLHGGPGGGNKDSNKLSFNPKHQRVIFHDQRGAGKSMPFAETRDNTTENLVKDIEALRKHFDLPKIQLTGGSWGSTLALCYAIAHPTVVERMFLWSIWLARKEDNDFVYKGAGKSHFPEVWKRFIMHVPPKHHNDPVSYYEEQLNKPDVFIRTKYVTEWNLFERSLMDLDGQIDKMYLSAGALEDFDDSSVAVAKLEAHYIKHHCFIPENHILKHAKKLQQIPTILVHGRYDFVCPPSGAVELATTLGQHCTLHVVPAGHSRSNATMREVTKAYSLSFLT